MSRKTAALVACGDIGIRLAARLDPAQWRCLGLRRSPGALPAGIEPVAADVTDVDSLRVLAVERPELLLFTPTPLGRDDAGYAAGFAAAARNIVTALDGHAPALALLVSSTRVYAERGGALIDEDAPLNREEPAARAIIEAEDAFLDALPGAVVLRAGGLYGDGPGYLLRRVAAGELTPREPLRYSNRVHRDDLAGFMGHLLEHGAAERIYSVVDDVPASLQEVERWLCEALGIPYTPPGPLPGQPRGHKRVSNRRLRDSGYALQYPDYRAGYAEILRRQRQSAQR
jgi:nucleoside-diphosphate-sugar epimerase